MSLRLVAWAAIALALAMVSPGAQAAAPADDVQDLVFFHEARPVFLRLHIEVDGKSFNVHWTETIARLHKYLDTDRDGLLSVKERAPWLSQLGPNRPRQGANSPSPAGRSVDSVSTVPDLADFLRPVFGPFQFQNVNRSGPAVETLFNLLDLDGDKSLSASELRSADATLMKLDQDDDETIRSREVLPYQNPFIRNARTSMPVESAPSSFLAIGPREPRAPLARRLLTSYDKHGGTDDGPGKDNRLQRDEIGLEPDAFAAADQDGDGGLDSDEIVHLLASPPPALELRARIIRNVPAVFSTLATVDTPNHPSPLASSVRKGTGNELAIALDPDRIEFHLARRRGINLRQFYSQQFQGADGDNNKYLDKQESQNNGIFNQIFTFMDRDADGKVFEKEMSEFVGSQVDAAESRTLLSVSDQGRSLFQVLDLNRDGRLSVRELRSSVKKIELWDRNHDGAISLEEIPRHYRLEFTEGTSPLLINLGVQEPGDNPNNNLASMPSTGKVPAWFRRMDLNLDGDVSTREFLGTSAQFQALDTDHDGLLDPSEASKAH